MKLILLTFSILVLTSISAHAEDKNSGFGTSYFAEIEHPGFSDPENTPVESITKIEPAAGEEEVKREAIQTPPKTESDQLPSVLGNKSQ